MLAHQRVSHLEKSLAKMIWKDFLMEKRLEEVTSMELG